MKLQNITINNFRGIRNLSLEDFGDINLLIGKNNVGKTSILESIFLILGPTNPALPISINGFRNLVHTDGDDFRFIFHELDFNQELKIESDFTLKDHHRELNIKPQYRFNAKGNNISKTNGIDKLSSDSRIESNDVHGITLNFSLKEKHKPIEHYNTSAYLNRGTLELETDKAVKYKETLRGVFIHSKDVISNERLEKIIINKQQKELIEILQKVDSSIVDISLGANNMSYFDIGLPRLLPSNMIGDGVRKLLDILVTIANNPNGIVLIDEIENGLHFTSIRVLWEAIIAASQKYKTQLFITTHSVEVLNFLKRQIENSEENSSEDFDFRTYSIKRFKDGGMKAFKYNFEEFEYALEQETEIR